MLNNRKLAEAIDAQTEALLMGIKVGKAALEWFKSHAGAATKQDLEMMEIRIMSAISDYTARVNSKLDAIHTGIDGVTADVAQLKALIEQLQNNPGPISPEDQALLDQLEARVSTAADKLTALDAQTEPPAPPA